MDSIEERRWYIVQTYAGYENRVKANLEQRIATMGMEDRIFSVLVPVEERMSVKDGKSKKVTRKLFPSYVLVEMRLNDQSWYVVRHTPGVTGFVGSGNHPIPLTEKEVREIMGKVGKEIWGELRGCPVHAVTTEEKSSYYTVSKTKTYSTPSREREFIMPSSCGIWSRPSSSCAGTSCARR